ncbi:MAG: DUF4382 domain-containing protein [Pseudomonadota bacterium]
MNQSSVLIKLTALVAVTLSATACTGSVNLDVTDAPVDGASKVVVEVSGVTFQPTGADAFTVDFDTPLSIDLLALRDGDTEPLISGKKMRDGKYDSMTLLVNASGDGSDSYITLTSDPTTKIPLVLASEDEDGLTISGGFSVEKDETQNYVIDFDLRKSVRDPATGETDYQLKPALRLVNADESGSIKGTVTGAGASGCAPAVYVYKGSSATTGDEGSANSPYASTRVYLDGGTYKYFASFLPPGNYTVAATCSADEDSADEDGDITLTGGVNKSVQTGVQAVLDFAL